MSHRITEDPPRGVARNFVVHAQHLHSRCLIELEPLPAEKLRNGQCADLALVLAACLFGAPPPGISLTGHAVHDNQTRTGQIAFEDHEGHANVVLLMQDDVSLEGETSPRWQSFAASSQEFASALFLLAAHLAAHRIGDHLHADPVR